VVTCPVGESLAAELDGLGVLLGGQPEGLLDVPSERLVLLARVLLVPPLRVLLLLARHRVAVQQLTLTLSMTMMYVARVRRRCDDTMTERA
jgi:hypothetical protein